MTNPIFPSPAIKHPALSVATYHNPFFHRPVQFLYHFGGCSQTEEGAGRLGVKYPMISDVNVGGYLNKLVSMNRLTDIQIVPILTSILQTSLPLVDPISIRVCSHSVFWARNGRGFCVQFSADYGCFYPPILLNGNSVLTPQNFSIWSSKPRRSFQKIGHVHSWRRNRVKNDRAMAQISPIEIGLNRAIKSKKRSRGQSERKFSDQLPDRVNIPEQLMPHSCGTAGWLFRR